MREVFEIINEYPWTTFFCWLMVVSIVAVFATIFTNKDE